MRRILRRYPIPDHVWHDVTRKIGVLRGLDSVQMVHLRKLSTWFMHSKAINGAHDMEVTQEMRVVVAAQACLLILNLDIDYFDNWVEVILYPGGFRVNREQMDGMGLVRNEASDLSGEAWLRGPVILSWGNVERDTYHAEAGHNVVFHEFAHKLDGRNGVTNGLPPLRRGMSQKSWAEDLSAAYEKLCLQVAAGEPIHVNPYAATNPAEFFAVMSEYFFTAPELLKNHYPGVHSQLAQFYLRAAARN